MANTPKPIDRWTAAERAWFASYRRHGNMARAVREAGYDVDAENYALHSQMGREIAARPHMQAAIEAYREELMGRYSVNEDTILGELAKIAFANVADFIKREPDTEDEEGNVVKGRTYIDLDGVPEHQLAALQAIQEKDGELKVTLAGKVSALELLGKWAKLWTDRLEVDGAVDPVARLQAARRRAGLIEETKDGQGSEG